ncbi:Hypothetical predicted protein [Lecanosticta acicola]|uniref:Uncharacterized protein n=1 Tax=Lecanosticta acicola TaxID=111012 RepID=A0AAI8Z2Y1_9PEZI|nr:Hypothetical predicted protein [Lecanosticta acicola]
MFFSLGSSKDGRGSRKESLASIFQHVSGKNNKKSKSAMSMVQTADEFLMVVPDPPSRKPKRSQIAGFFRGWGNGWMSNKTRYRASRIIKPPSPGGHRPQQMRALDIDDSVLERVMGKTKDEKKQASENFILQQKIRARSRSRTRGACSLDEPQVDGQRGRTKPLTTEEAQEMFVGAPYFNVGKVKSGYRPQVVFVDEKSKVLAPGSTDHRDLSHASFLLSTLGAEPVKRDAKAVLQSSRAALRELPSMLSSHGTETGTTSFEHFLQLAISDDIRYTVELPRFENRKLLYADPGQLGLQEMNTDSNVERLAELETLLKTKYSDDDTVMAMTNEQQISRMGEELFTRILCPPKSMSIKDTTLKVQIEALQNILGMKEVWPDFGLPDTRLKIGQSLWSGPINNARRPSLFDKDHEPSEREIVLLQITLAAELLIRLAIVRAVSFTRNSATTFLSLSDRLAIESQRTAKVNWDLVLAERFLENVEVSIKASDKPSKNGLFSVLSQLTSKERSEPFYQPRNQERQISGLVHFAESLHWPNAARLEKELLAKLVESTEDDAADIGGGDRGVNEAVLQRRPSGFTGDLDPNNTSEKAQRFLGMRRSSRSSRPGSRSGSRPGSRSGSRQGTARSEHGGPRFFGGRQDTVHNMHLHKTVDNETSGGEVNVGGWMSRTWLCGLVMPGEAASDFLISAVLENTPHALNTIGDVANLQSGFVYQGRSYWSKSSVIGRVMAASKDAVECMGWISVAGMPRGHKEGWVASEIRDVPYCDDSMARMTDPEAVAKDSDPMGSGERMAVQQTDFTTPHDGLPVMGNEVRSQGLAFTESEFAGEAPIPSITFSSPINSKLSTLTVTITYNVHFVSSYPCHPEMRKPKIITKPKAKPKPKRKPAPEPDFSGDLLPSDFVIQYEAEQYESEEEEEEEEMEILGEIGPQDSARCSTSPSGGYIMADEAMREVPPPPCHSLHVDYKYETIPVATLMTEPPEERPRALSVPDARAAHPEATAEEEARVVVLDCRGTEDLQLLGRAWCSKVAENAIVAKVGRTCLACSIREAKALGFSVVIRI